MCEKFIIFLGNLFQFGVTSSLAVLGENLLRLKRNDIVDSHKIIMHIRIFDFLI